MQGVNIHQDEVSTLARLQRAGDVADVHGLRPEAGSHEQRGLGGQHGGITLAQLGEESGQAHFLEHV